MSKSNKAQRNKLCPCGSGKKYKRCYLNKSLDCDKYRKEQHEEEFSYIDKYLHSAMKEFSDSWNKLSKDSPRVKLLIAFVFFELFASYWKEYTKHNNKKLVEWTNCFCLNKDNEIYDKNDYLNKLNGEDFYHMRNSLLHFFSLNSHELGDKTIWLVNGVENSINIKRIMKDYKKTRKTEIPIVLSPETFFSLFINGGKIMIKKLQTGKGIEHEARISNIYNEVKRQGVEIVSI